MFDVPEYSRFLDNADWVRIYGEYLELLRHSDLTGKADAPILLKAPQHAAHVASFLAVFPQFEVVWLRRNHGECMRSFTDLVAATRALFYESTDMLAVENEWKHYWERHSAIPAGVEVVDFADVEDWARSRLGENGANSRRFAEWLSLP
jgi:hypothetical protein